MTASRVFLFLQGPSSRLFSDLADHLDRAGCRTLRINLNAGDRMFWRRKGGLNYRGRPANWRAFVSRVIRENGVTDVVLLGEERPYHRVAIEEAKAFGADIYVMEMGYLRPDWITLERGGMSSNSHFPDDPDHILAAAADLPPPDWRRRYTQTFFREAMLDLMYNLPTVGLWFLYPFYQRHAIFHPLREYLGWLLLRLPHRGRKDRRARRATHRLIISRSRFFIYPLQLQTDYQIRAHSPYTCQKDAIFDVLSSFAHHAPPETVLVIKTHPLDNGLIDWKGFVRIACKGVALDDRRVVFLEGGNITKMVRYCAGMVTVNSSSAFEAIRKTRPIKLLGSSIYDVDGLVDRTPLNDFWTNPQPPDPRLRRAFLTLLAAAIQVRGNLYSTEGAAAAAAAAAERLLERTVNEPNAFVDPPPRKRPQKNTARRSAF